MSKNSVSGQVRVLGIDLGKSVFHLHGVDEQGRKVLSKRLKREQMLAFLAQFPACLVGLEACGGAHYWARKLREYGHDARLMAPQYVKPYVKRHKNDSVDAEAICEAVSRPNMRYVSIKSEAQQDVMALHRLRSLAVKSRTGLVNQLRGLLHERGIIISKGIDKARHAMTQIAADESLGLSEEFRTLLTQGRAEFERLDKRISEYACQISELSKATPKSRLLETMPGVGPLGATALLASIGDVRDFKNGRELAAWIGLVPNQHSTGGKSRLGGISKRGNLYLRNLLIHGARSALRGAKSRTDQRSQWAEGLRVRRGNNVAAVALANRMARSAWAILMKEEAYQANAAM